MGDLFIHDQLSKMNISYKSVSEIRNKDGIYVYSVKNLEKSYVLKYFEKEEYRREVNNYIILQQLNIPTIPLISYTDKSILMVDINESKKYRLGTLEDMNDMEVCTSLGTWYRILHENGKAYVRDYGDEMYMESNCITAENIEFIKGKTQTQHNEVWKIIQQNLEILSRMIDKTEKTLTYNDFYYTNMVVAKDKSDAFMFDYNFLGKGYAYSDIKNFTWAISESARRAFLDAYGKYNEDEVLLHEVVSPLSSLYSACCRDVFPQWGHEVLKVVKSGYLLECANKLFH